MFRWPGAWMLLWPRAFYDNVLGVSALSYLVLLLTGQLALAREVPHVLAPRDVYPM